MGEPEPGGGKRAGPTIIRYALSAGDNIALGRHERH
jgi:hypothetical protein